MTTKNLMKEELEIKIDEQGNILRVSDDKHLALLDIATGELKFSNAAYAKGKYKKKILELVESSGNPPEEVIDDLPGDVVTGSDPRVPSSFPPKDASLGSFSAAHINFDHSTLSDADFYKKYGPSSECQLEFISNRPELFADREELEARLSNIPA